MRKSRSGVVFFGDAARITLPGPDLGTGGELGGAGRTTLPRNDLGAGGELGGAGRTTLPGPSHGTGGELGGAGRTTCSDQATAPEASWVVRAAPL
ncbi:hypothetical protein CDO43_03170 [Pseudomonas aeruginosa]|nr:hypothetical protein CDO43_03170 [Pseudomonas aeruginosa]